MENFKSEETRFVVIREKLFTSAVRTPIETYLESIKSGLFGFLFVFTLIILSKLFSYSVNGVEYFSISLNDVVFSFWGFVVLSFVVFISKIKNVEE